MSHDLVDFLYKADESLAQNFKMRSLIIQRISQGKLVSTKRYVFLSDIQLIY